MYIYKIVSHNLRFELYYKICSYKKLFKKKSNKLEIKKIGCVFVKCIKCIFIIIKY